MEEVEVKEILETERTEDMGIRKEKEKRYR
jgi:hypothetical protein